MNPRVFRAGAFLLMAPLAAVAAGAFTALHPEEAYPDPTEQVSPHPYTGFITRVQEKLGELGFAAGPANGDFGAKTQAALAQFQLSRAIPASGQLDDETLAELGVQRDNPEAASDAASGASIDPAAATAPAGTSAERTAEPKPQGLTEHPPEPRTGEKPGS